MQWNWQKDNWPEFSWDKAALQPLEANFRLQAGVLIGSIKHLPEKDRIQLVVETMTDEAIKTSAIENEFLNRDSVQSSILRTFGLETDARKIPPAERGIAEMLNDLYRHYDTPLSDATLFLWHKMLTSGRHDLADIGRYRTGAEPMQVVSNLLGDVQVHFEAPPSSQVDKGMHDFLSWFERTAPGNSEELPALTRAGIAHLYFVSIHPFEDGNGRIARSIAEKALSQSLGQPTLIALSHMIEAKRKNYYRALELNNKDTEITDWLVYFAQTIIEAQAHTQSLIDFILAKTKFYDRFRGQLNERQMKVIARIFREGPGGFTGGLSREKYVTITGTSTATATRDLAELLDIGVLMKKGDLKSARYFIKELGHAGDENTKMTGVGLKQENRRQTQE